MSDRPSAKSTVLRKPALNPRRAERKRQQRKANPEKHRTENAARYASLTEADKLERSWKRCVRPPVLRADRTNLTRGQQRRAALSDAYCDWSDDAEVYRMYMAAHVLSNLFDTEYVVDHTVPLQSPLVCGLHTHTNLRIELASDNRIKGNMFWPGMWEQNWDTLALLLENQ